MGTLCCHFWYYLVTKLKIQLYTHNFWKIVLFYSSYFTQAILLLVVKIVMWNWILVWVSLWWLYVSVCCVYLCVYGSVVVVVLVLFMYSMCSGCLLLMWTFKYINTLYMYKRQLYFPFLLHAACILYIQLFYFVLILSFSSSSFCRFMCVCFVCTWYNFENDDDNEIYRKLENGACYIYAKCYR